MGAAIRAWQSRARALIAAAARRAAAAARDSAARTVARGAPAPSLRVVDIAPVEPPAPAHPIKDVRPRAASPPPAGFLTVYGTSLAHREAALVRANALCVSEVRGRLLLIASDRSA